MSYSTSSSITRKDVDKATLVLSINNFAEAKNNKKNGQQLKSDTFRIGASKFNIGIYPSGHTGKDKDFVSVFLNNTSEHNVTVKYIMSIRNKEDIYKSVVIKSGKGWGHARFIKASEVGQNLEVKADVTLLKEEDLDGHPGGLSLADWQFQKKSEAENQQKLEQKLVKLEQKMEEKLEQKLEQKLTSKHNDLKRKIHEEFDDLKEDLKAPARAPECPICFEEMRPPMQIIQCLKGHKLCEPCSQKPEIPCCPDGCKAGFMGRDFGMEAFILHQFNTRRQ